MQKLLFWILFVMVTRYGTSASSSISSSLSTTLEPTETTLSFTSFQTTPITASPSKTTSNVKLSETTTKTLSEATSSITSDDDMQSTATPFKTTPHVESSFETASNIAPSETILQTTNQSQTKQSTSIPSKIITSTDTLSGTITNKVQPSTADASQTTLKIMPSKTTSNIKTTSGIVSNSVPSKATLSTPIPSIASSIVPSENSLNISGNEINSTTTKPSELTSRIGLSTSTSSMKITPSETISDVPSSNSIAFTTPSKPTTSSESKLITTNISETNSNIPMNNTTLYIPSPEITPTTTTPSKTSISNKTTHKILITSTPIPTTLSKITLNIAPSKTILSTITPSKNISSTSSFSDTTSNIAPSKLTTCTTTHCKTTLSLASFETTLSTLKSSKTSVSNTTSNQVQFETTPIPTTLPKTTLHTASSKTILITTTPSMASNTTPSAKIMSNTETLSKATSSKITSSETNFRTETHLIIIQPSLTTSSKTSQFIINTNIAPTKTSSITKELALTTASAIVQPTETQNVPASKVTDATTPSIDEKHPPITPNTDKEVKIQFEIEVGDAKTPFDKTLYNHNSKKFKHYKESFENKLKNAYSGTPGYRGVEVYAFRKGSIIADYRLIIDSYKNVAEAKNHITKEVLKNIPAKILEFSVNTTFVNENIKQTVKQFESGCEYFSQAVCPTGYRCEMKNKKPICTEICWKEDGSNLCGNHGTCYVDIKTYKGKCSCSNSNGFVYHGVYCERKAEELKLDSVYIIAIASGSGGAVLIIAVVAVACLIHMKRKMKTLFLTNTDVNSAEMDDFGWERSSDLNANLYRARVKSVANDNKTRLQEQDATYFQGREHRLYKDDKGDEAYIYQPSSHKSSAETEYNTGPSVYDYIDTDSKFQIQRPNISLGHLNKY